MFYFLRTGTDSLDGVTQHKTLADAKADFMETADELHRYGQTIDASVHMAQRMADVDEYPDYVMSRGPRGGCKCERV